MEKSENFEFNLPSSDSDDIVDVNQISDNFRIIDTELYEATQNASKEYVDNAISGVKDIAENNESDIEAVRQRTETLASTVQGLEDDVDELKQSSVTIGYVQETYATKNEMASLEDDIGYIHEHYATKQYVDNAVASSGGGTGGGVSSWNDLTDKPFYEGFITTILDYSNLPTVSGALPTGSVVYKVTDDILTSEQLEGSVITVEVTNTDGNIHNDTLTLSPLSAVHSVQLPLGTIYYDDMLIESLGKEVTFFISVAEQEGTFDFNGTSFTVPETGTYLGLTTHNGETQNSMSLEYNGIKTLDIKFIPDDLYTEIDQRIENYINEALGGEY